jgi:3-mercaptopyruvate sulfurtransferase SseA
MGQFILHVFVIQVAMVSFMQRRNVLSLSMAAERIPIPELQKKLDAAKNLVVVDVREPSEIKESGAIPGALRIPMAQIEKRMGELPKNAEIVFY